MPTSWMNKTSKRNIFTAVLGLEGFHSTISAVFPTHQYIETMFASNKMWELQVVIKFGVT